MKEQKNLFLFICLVTLLIVVNLRLRNYAYDDAYIHFRIARNFVQFGQPYYNVGQPVMASSSSGWTILLAGLFVLFGANPIVASIANAIFLASGACVFCLLANQIHPKPPIFNILYGILYIGFLMGSSIGLMETPFCFLLLGVSLLLYFKKNPFSLLLFGTLPFFRLELFFFSAVILLFTLFNHRFSLIKTFLLPLLGAIPFLAYDLVFFGTIIPNTVYAKQAGYLVPAVDNSINIIQAFFPLNPGALSVFASLFIVMIVILPFPLLILIKHHDKIYAFEWALIISGLFVIAFYLLGKTLIFGWYLPLFVLPIFLPFYRVALDHAQILKRFYVTLIVLPAILLLWQYSSAAIMIPLISSDLKFNARTTKYLEVGQKLYEEYPNACLMSSEIGGLGWAFKGCILDGMGLASPEAIRFHDGRYKMIGNLPIQYIKLKQPEIIVSINWFMLDFTSSDLSADYLLQKEPILVDHDLALLPNDPHSDFLEIFIRKDLIEQKGFNLQ